VISAARKTQPPPRFSHLYVTYHHSTKPPIMKVQIERESNDENVSALHAVIDQYAETITRRRFYAVVPVPRSPGRHPAGPSWQVVSVASLSACTDRPTSDQ